MTPGQGPAQEFEVLAKPLVLAIVPRPYSPSAFTVDVIAPAEFITDSGQRSLGRFLGQEHPTCRAAPRTGTALGIHVGDAHN